MRVNWRTTRAAKNSFAALYAACEMAGFTLHPVSSPASDITCYSLTTVMEQRLRDEIAAADCITIVGGPHPSACFRDVAGYADYVVVGEGEYVLPQLLAHIEKGLPGAPPGVATLSGYTPTDTTVILDAFPPFTEFKGYIEISRGCPHRCGYCQTPSLFGCRMRHRSIDEVAAAAAGYRDVRFVSPNALAYGSDGLHPRLEKVERLLSRLKCRIFFGTFPSEVRPEFVTSESLGLITGYCANSRLHFGAQSGSERILRRLGRGHTTDDVLRAIDLCRDFGLTPVVDFIFGLPFEDDDDQRATMDLIRETVKDGQAHVHKFMPLPGTALSATNPRPVLPEIERALGRLALAGSVTGSWMDAEIRFFRENQDSYP